MKPTISSMINGKRYEQVLDLKTMRSLLEMLDNVMYRNEAEEIIQRYSEKTHDVTQLKTLSKIAKFKILRPPGEYNNSTQHITVQSDPIIYVNKTCPHCSKECEAQIDTEYVICGYTNSKTGYNLIGCGKDWCFKCGKILCKKWDIHQLFLPTNKHHDGECCKKHARETNKQYPNDYCQCCNINVSR